MIGSTIGAISASVLLLASLGVEFSIRAAALIALSMAIVVATKARRFSMATGALAGSAMLIILALDPSGERSLKSFGIYSGARTYATYDLTKLRQLVEAHELLYYRDGPTATVAVQQIDRFRLLKINGKTDASNGPGDVETQLLLGHAPFLMRDAEQVAVIGWGSGMTVDAVLKHPVERVTAFEIEPAVVEASRFFEPGNGAPLEDERVELIMGDARNELRRREQLYDVIISEPSNPWLTGVANLFTKDFFEIAASRLAPDGVMCQWFHLYGMSEDSTRSLIATFREQFPHVIAFKDRDLILLGSTGPIRLSLERLQNFYSIPALQESLARAGMAYPSDILVNVTLDSDGAEAYASEGVINTDDNMRLELAAPKSLYRDEVDSIVESHAPPSSGHLAAPGFLRTEVAVASRAGGVVFHLGQTRASTGSLPSVRGAGSFVRSAEDAGPDTATDGSRRRGRSRAGARARRRGRQRGTPLRGSHAALAPLSSERRLTTAPFADHLFVETHQLAHAGSPAETFLDPSPSLLPPLFA